MRTCERCGKEKPLKMFSEAKVYKKTPQEQYGHTCLICSYEDDNERLKAEVKRSKEVKEYKRKRTRIEKQRVRDGVNINSVAHAAQRSGLVLTFEALKKVREEAKTYKQRRTADSQLRKLLKERAKALKDLDPKDLPAHLAFEPDEFPFLLPQKSQTKDVTPEKPIETTPEGKVKLDPGDAEQPRTPKRRLQKELAARTLARRKLVHFIKRTKPDYEAGWVHYDICRRLEKFAADVEAGKNPRLMLFMPPRHGKSLIASDMFPSWVLGKHPDWEIIAASYAVSLPIEFSRFIRDRMKDEAYQALFPKVNLRPDSQNAERWKTQQNGGYVAAGIGGGITGKGAHVLIIDDPIKDAEEADSEVIREKAWNWFGSTAYTRLAPKSGVLVIQCMTGDTAVLRPDGSETRLDELRPGDEVATYDRGRLTSAKVLNHASQGYDDVIAITTTSGKVVRANARHPFLAQTERGLEWVRASNLKSGQRIVTVKDSGGSGKVRNAVSKGAEKTRGRGVCAIRTITSGNGRAGTDPLQRHPWVSEKRTSSIATGLLLNNTLRYLRNRVEGALSAVYQKVRSTLRSIGTKNYAWITAPIQKEFVDCYATTATCSSNEETLQKFSNPLSDTDDFTTEKISSIELAGVDEVFDIEVEGTHNFIANLLVVSNTRWNDGDLSGRLITKMQEQIKEGAPQEEIDDWEIIEYPAIATETEWLMPDGSIAREVEQPHIDAYKLRSKGEALHEKRFSLTRLKQIKRTLQPRHWSALYQQNPMPDEGEYFTKDMFRFAGSLPPLHEMKIYAAFDLAIGEKQQNDYTVGIVGGVDYNDQLYVFDMLRFKGDTFKIVEAVLDVYKKYKPEVIGIEKGQLELAIKPVLKKRMRERRLFPTLAEGDKALVPINDKLTRARPLQGRMQQGMVYFLNTQPWVETAEFELLRFPGGVHDDIVDALAWLTRLTMQEEPPPKPSAALLRKSWKKKLNEYVGAGARGGYMAS